MKVLFLTSSYPVPEHPWLGIFVREHARAAGRSAEVAVAHIDRSEDVRGIRVENGNDDEFRSVRVRYPASPAPVSYAANVAATAAAYRRLRFEPDAVAAEEAVRRHEARAAFFLPPTRVERIRPIVERGERLPEKSTFFWPKPRTGMVIRPLDAGRREEPSATPGQSVPAS